MQRLWLAFILALTSFEFVSAQLGSDASKTRLARSAGELVFQSNARYTKPPPRIPPLGLPDGRIIVTAGNIVYMVGQDGRTLWKYSALDVVTAQPAYRADRDEIAIVDSVLEFLELSRRHGSGSDDSSRKRRLQIH